ncbi:hypothetical protein [Mumia sp. Pv 4-285]|uniref:hypothetical protein n=1 Tax=Mumia qirimensis TaxID=3234852 RepID=UPI00351D390B
MDATVPTMRTAVMRIVVDHEGLLSGSDYETGLSCLREEGFDVVATPAEKLPDKGREIEMIIEEFDPDAQEAHVAACRRAFGIPATPGVVTFISRGTDDDARGVLQAFDIDGKVERILEGDDEVVAVTLDPLHLRRVPESRLHTALEAALNCEVRIVVGS